ncbi:MAG: guanylate kinase [Actinomycetota bacterium]|nr:guanylate kinase [Actinomycetota bacterium]
MDPISGDGGGNRGRLFVVSGPSGAGKGTVIQEVLRRRPEIVLSVSVTTRPARRQERQGVHYNFVGEPEFKAMRDRGDLLESARVHGNFYGTPRPAVEAALAGGRDVICELDIQGAESVKRAKPEAILIFIEPPSMEDLHTRLRNRGTESPDDMSSRIDAAYAEIKRKELYDHIVINDRLEDAVDHLLRILDG